MSNNLLRQRAKMAGKQEVVFERAMPTNAPESTSEILTARTADTFANRMNVASLKKEMMERIRAKVPDELLQPNNEKALDKFITEQIEIEEKHLPVAQRNALRTEIKDELKGAGPLEPLLQDEEITEIMINGPFRIYIEKNGELQLTNVKFHDLSHLTTIIEKLIAPSGRKIDKTTPYVDAKIRQGYRLNAVYPPIAISGPDVTIRKFRQNPFTYKDLIEMETLTPETTIFIEYCVLSQRNIGISGGTGSGKTTLLNVASNFIPDNERIIVLEDSNELKLDCPHAIYWETRTAGVEGRGRITMTDLVRNSLRARPDRIVVGECRGVEAMDMLQAMNTGHDGSLTTGHANTPLDFLRRLEWMCLQSGIDVPLRALREQIASAMNIVIQTGRVGRNSQRKVVTIAEVCGLDSDGDYILNVLFDLQHDAVTGKYTLEPTGKRPSFFHRLDSETRSIFIKDGMDGDDE